MIAAVILYILIVCAVPRSLGLLQSISTLNKRKFGRIVTLKAILEGTKQVRDDYSFGGMKFQSPVADSLRTLKIDNPTPIQAAALGPVASGLSCILHAATGTGKTLCYALPLLKRLYNEREAIGHCRPFQALILVPTRELAVQVASDINSLTDGDNDMVELCVNGAKRGFQSMTAPIVVGTPYKVLDTIRASGAQTAVPLLADVEYLVLDEVDRLISALGRYATHDRKKANDSFQNPTLELIHMMTRIKSRMLMKRQEAPGIAEGAPSSVVDSGFQVVAASATVGRPLRRELHKLFQVSTSAGTTSKQQNRSDEDGDRTPAGQQRYGGQFPVIRPDAPSSSSTTTSTSSDSGGSRKISRHIGIPETIEHIAILDSQEFEKLSGKLTLVKEKWMKHTEMKRGILFVPRAEDVEQIIGILTFWGVGKVMDLQQALGTNSPVGESERVRRMKAATKGGKANMKPAAGSGGGATTSNNTPPSPTARTRLKTEDFIKQAQSARIGSASRCAAATTTAEEVVNLSSSLSPTTAADGDNGEESSTTSSRSDGNSSGRELFVIPLSGSRGLHLQDIECVMLLAPPRTMDEYLHAAGRTGREGNRVNTGVVYTVATLDDLKRLQSWQTPLGIEFDVKYS